MIETVNWSDGSAIFIQETQHPEPKSNYGGGGGQGVWWPIVNKTWDGEKTPGELGAVIRNIPDYFRLRLRSMDAYIKTDTIKIIASKHFDHVIGSGLKLQVEPNQTVLKSSKIPGIADFDFAGFKKIVEARWTVYASSFYCDYARQNTLHKLVYEYYKAKYLGGDFLVVLRVDDFGPNMQFISGEFIQTPFLDTDGHLAAVKERGNYIEHGIEFDERGQHVAYFVTVRDKDSLLGKIERIPARGQKTGRKMAWMVYGERISLDHKRGIPETAQVLEKAMKLDRYTEAAVSKAEQAAKLVYTVKHQSYSTGENPMDELVKKKMKLTGTDIDSYALGEGVADRVAKTTNNLTVNLPPGAEFDSFDTNIETKFAEFHTPNFNQIAAASNIPPEVALQLFGSNYSASRAATMGWGYIVDIKRDDFVTQVYKPFYMFWFEVEILKNNIEAPGYIMALAKKDIMITEAFTTCRFIGRNQPQIDPLKEANAARVILGGNDQTPLASHEQVTENLNLGDWNENYAQYQEESKTITPAVEPLKSQENDNTTRTADQ